MFGRNYGGTPGAQEPTQALAWRMRAAQQLVFGEQIGWFNLRLLNEAMPMAFIRQLAWLRWRLRRYFYAGEMARPPKLEGRIPHLRANWEWHASQDNPWVSSDALMCSAWRMLDARSVALLFVNVSDEPIDVSLRWNAADYAATGLAASAVLLDGERDLATRLLPDKCDWALSFPAQQALAIRAEWLP